MQIDFVWTLLISLGLTLILELGYSLFLRVRGAHDLSLVILVNIITNPAVVLLNKLLTQKTELSPILIVFSLEIAAFLVEGFYYMRNAEKIKLPFLFSLGANVFSFFTGLLITHIF